MYVLQQIQRRPLDKKLKMTLTTLPTIAGNATTAFPASLLSASANLFNHLFKTPSSFGGEPPPPPPARTSIMASAIVEIVLERAVSVEKIVIPSSRNNVRILSAKAVFLSRIFLRVCLILATCV